MKNNPLLDLQTLGQSIWMDFIRRETITSGELRQLIEEDGVSGVTSNPSIFEKAIAESHDYDEAIRALTLEGKTTDEIYQLLTVEDIQMVADLLRPTYDRTDGQNGFVSLEVSPELAYDTTGTIEEARRLWSLVDRPNAMIKVPATLEGLPAIQQLTGEGINVNITLLFGLPRYQEVADAYITGLETLAAKGRNLRQVASVASFFLSRIDVHLDPIFEKMMLAGGRQADSAALLHGQVAIASAKAAYQMYQVIFGSDRFKKLTNKGARAQRLLWASTSTKNPTYSDTRYIEPLIGPDTINTLLVETLAAYRDHGHPKLSLDQNVSKAYRILNHLSFVGINLNAVTQHLEQKGVENFIVALDRLMVSLKEKQDAVQEPLMNWKV
ncbi:MAG: transaldolase [Anaerolineae bacterium]|nr:transaldolase [Anaerolineae bacterium]MCI0610229.1 transaldolase [Anaerolineae bacterium]